MEYLWSDKKRTFLGLPLSFTKYALNEERLFIETGFLNKVEDEVRLYRIMDVSLRRSFWQRIFRVGTIHCCSADKTMGDFDIVSIKKPKDVKEQLSQLIEEQRMAKKVTNNVLSFLENKTNDFNDRIALGMRNNYGWSEFTYQGLGSLSRTIASYLINELQVEKGEHVAIVSESKIEFGAAFFASVIAGSTFIPLDIKLTTH